MRFTKSLDQATCIIILLTTQEKNKAIATDKISEKLSLSTSYTKKIIRKMVVKGIVKTTFGANGGVALNREVNQITLLEIIEAIEEIEMCQENELMKKVFDGLEHTERGQQVLKDVFGKADEKLKEYYRNITVQDVLEKTFGKDKVIQNDWNKDIS